MPHNHFLEQVRHYHHHAIAHETPELTFDPKAPTAAQELPPAEP